MGALSGKLPITYATMLIATLAISAIPPFAGYFSKDLVLEGAYASGHFWLWLIGVITAGITSFYMFRLIFMTFHGDSRVDPEKAHHVHESPPVMTIPLIVLAVLRHRRWLRRTARRLALGQCLQALSRTGLCPSGWRPARHVNLRDRSPCRQPVSCLSADGAGRWPARNSSGVDALHSKSWRCPAASSKVCAVCTNCSGASTTSTSSTISSSRARSSGSRSIVLNHGVDRDVIDGIVNGTGAAVEDSGEAAAQNRDRQRAALRLRLSARRRRRRRLLCLPGDALMAGFWLTASDLRADPRRVRRSAAERRGGRSGARPSSSR